MRKTFAIGMALVLAAGMPVFAESTSTSEQETVVESAVDSEAGEIYQLGDKIEDFTATLSDGSEVSLYELLGEKKAVLINLWASWCGPCKSEFPAMQEAYDEMSDDIGVIALSQEASDTDEIVNQLKDDLGLTTLPMGVDTIGLGDHFDTDAIPVSIMVDKNGVICFIENGALTDKDDFLRLFQVFTADDYDEPQLLEQVPARKPDIAAPSADEMKQAVGTDEMAFAAADPEDNIWPFVVSEDGTSLEASNGSIKGSQSAFAVAVDAQEGQALSFEYTTNCLTYYQGLYVVVDNEVQTILSGDNDWTENYVTFDEPGEHTVQFVYTRDNYTTGDTEAAVRNLRLASEDELPAKDEGVKTLEGSEISIEPISGETKPVTFTFASDGTNVDLGDTTVPYEIMQSDEMTVRIRIGKELNADDVFFGDGTYYYMLNELPTDDEGYLYTINSSDVDQDEAFPIVILDVYSSLKDSLSGDSEDGLVADAEYTVIPSEEAMNKVADYYVAFLKSLSDDISDVSADWEYDDGSAKKETQASEDASSEEASNEAADGYTVYVSDENGKPVSSVMVQICDDTTCQVFFTDDNGMVSCAADQDSYDVHILKVPDGYEKPEDLFNVSKDQKTLSVTLKSAE